MSYGIRRSLVAITVVLVVGWLVSGCSGAPSDSGSAVGTSGQAIGVQITSGFITIENRTEHPLVDARIAIRAGSLFYTSQLPRLAPGDKRDLSLGDFRAPDASPINVNLRRPNEIVVTASDVDGKKYEVKVPWKQ